MSTPEESLPVLSSGNATIEIIPTTDLPKGANDTVTLVQVSPEIHYLPSTSKPLPNAPSAILMFSWMGAPVRHMSKFIEYYSKTLFPGTPIILVLSPQNQFFDKHEIRQRRMQAAYDTYKALNVRPQDTLVHIFSMGGVNALRTFVSLTPTNTFPAKVLVIDSAPGTDSIWAAMKAFTANMKSRLARLCFSILIAVWFSVGWLWEWIIGRQRMSTRLYKFMTESGAIGKETRRLYLYSTADELAPGVFVEKQIKELRDLGYNVKAKNFGKTGHVGHMRANPKVYWEEVEGVWKGE